MVYKPIQRKKSYEKVIDQIVQMIKNKQLKPGDKLDSIENLATQFEVSRSVIREALSGLRAMELIDIQQGEGTFIKNFNASSIAKPSGAAAHTV